MKFHFEVTAGRFLRNDVKQNLENSKRKLEFTYPECQILLTESKSFFETVFYIEGKNIPDEAAVYIRKWIDDMKRLEN